MPLSLFIGASGVSLAPLLSLFVIFVAPNNIRVLFWISGAFCWLVSLLIASLIWLIWYAATSGNDALHNDLTFGAFIAVICQELVRIFSLWGLAKVVSTLEAMPSQRGTDRFGMSGSMGHFVMGLGFGSLACLFHMMNILAASLGPGSPGIIEVDGVSVGNPSLYLTSAFFSSGLTLNHCAWSVLAGSALSKGIKNHWYLVAYIFVAHFVCTGTSLYNQSGVLWPAMSSMWLSVGISGALAFKEAGFKGFSTIQMTNDL